MPTTTPLMKVNRTKSYGAEVILKGDVYDEACEYAYQLADEKGYTFIHPFDDLAVATGQGTIAMEIFKELPLVDIILVPIGGGGLAAGIAMAAKEKNPKIKVIGLEPVGAMSMKRSIEQGRPWHSGNSKNLRGGRGSAPPWRPHILSVRPLSGRYFPRPGCAGYPAPGLYAFSPLSQFPARSCGGGNKNCRFGQRNSGGRGQKTR